MKRTIAFLLCLFTVLAIVPFQANEKASAAEWDGSIKAPSVLTTVDGVYYYEISTAEELAYISQTGGNWLKYNYILKNDIVLNSVEIKCDDSGNLITDSSKLKKWTPINNLNGKFDGNGFSVSGVYVDVTTNYAGLFGNFSGIIKNVTIKNSYVKGTDYVGGIAGKANDGSITDCAYYGVVSGSDYVGGISGATNSMSIANCTVTCDAVGKYYVGGIAGEAYSGAITDSMSYGSVLGTKYIGGILGEGNLEKTGLIIGGQNYCSLRNCANNAKVFASDIFVGGITGHGGSLEKCLNRGNVSSQSDYVGGISGYGDCIDDCINEGEVMSAGGRVGGIAGYSKSQSYYPIDNCTNKGNVSGSGDYVGGIAGYCAASYSTIRNCKNGGNVNGNDYVGGIIGYREASNSFCSKSNNFGSVSGRNYVGGIAGSVSDYDLTECYNVGNVFGEANVGGVAGYSDSIWGKGTVSGCKYLKTDEINFSINGFGNAPDNSDVVESKGLAELCINKEALKIKGLHTYGTEFTEPKNGMGYKVNMCNDCKYENGKEKVFYSGKINHTLHGQKIIVNNKSACLLGYLVDGKYVSIKCLKNEDGTHSFTAPNGVTETLLIVSGDVNGDGTVDSTDYLRIKLAFLESMELDSETFFAADVTGDGQIDATDYLRIKGHFLGTFTLSYDVIDIGGIVTFGSYEQDNVTSNGKEAIEWQILDIQDDKALIISKYALDCKPYNNKYENTTWEECTLRSWLNNDFFNTAFSNEEKAKIPTVTVSADKNPNYNTDPGNATQDKVFLLSINDVNKYFSSDSERQCQATAYAKANGADFSVWWLRSPGYSQISAAYVYRDGSVDYGGIPVDGDCLGVRPALWISLES